MLYYDGYYSVEIVVWFTYRLELSIAKKACLIFENEQLISTNLWPQFSTEYSYSHVICKSMFDLKTE